MQYRVLGRTGLRVSAVSMGTAYLWGIAAEEACRIVHRALDMGVNYFDTARGYGNSEAKLGRALRGQRHQCYVGSKTGCFTKEEARRDIVNSLRNLEADHLEVYHIHDLRTREQLRLHMAPGGSLEGLQAAQREGLVRYIGITGHADMAVMAEAVATGAFDTVLVPISLAETEALEIVVPQAQKMGTAVVAMKPVGMGVLPARLAIKWLLKQPITCTVPGVMRMEELEEDMAAAAEPEMSPAEERELDALMPRLKTAVCRRCDRCLPCPRGINIVSCLGGNMAYNYIRNVGPARWRTFHWDTGALEQFAGSLRWLLASVSQCDRCGDCQRRCPYGLPIADMLAEMAALLPPGIAALEEQARRRTPAISHGP